MSAESHDSGTLQSVFLVTPVDNFGSVENFADAIGAAPAFALWRPRIRRKAARDHAGCRRLLLLVNADRRVMLDGALADLCAARSPAPSRSETSGISSSVVMALMAEVVMAQLRHSGLGADLAQRRADE
jgi:hypothetical protein